MNPSDESLSLDRPACYEIRIPGELDERWTDWISSMNIRLETRESGKIITVLTTTVDQAALQGLLRRLYSLGLPLISVEWVKLDSE